MWPERTERMNNLEFGRAPQQRDGKIVLHGAEAFAGMRHRAWFWMWFWACFPHRPFEGDRIVEAHRLDPS